MLENKEFDERTKDRRPKKRETWNRIWDFMFVSAGWTIGLGNVWRFPYVCYKYGGGAFLIPYLLFAVVFAFPTLIIETSLGQSLRQGLVKSWGIVSPIMKGLAYANLVTKFLEKIFYVVIITWIFKYLVASFSSDLPWASCNNTWNDDCCTESVINSTRNGSVTNTSCSQTAAEQYWNMEVLGITPGVEHVGSLRSDLVLYNLIIWVLVFFATFKGIKWSAKVTYVTATLPAILIFVVLIRGLTLDGAVDGIRFYLMPDLSKLLIWEVWTNAATQILYSTGTGTGILLLLRSHNNYHDDLYRDCMLIILCNALTSLFGGLAIFSTLGFMANHLNTTVDSVVKSGPGLAFMVYPKSLSLLPFPQFWCVLFFLMLFFLGFDSQFVGIEMLVRCFLDGYPQIYSYRYGKEVVTASFCVGMFLASLIMITEGGVYVFEMFNNYVLAGWNFLLLLGFQFVAIGWFYGAERQFKEIKKMIGPCRTERAISFIWKYLGPLFCFVLSTYKIALHKPLSYESYIYPTWAQVIAHLLSLVSFICIPGYAIYLLIISKKKFSELLRNTPNRDCEQNEMVLFETNSNFS